MQREAAEKGKVDSKEMVRTIASSRRIALTPVAFAALAALVLTLWLPFGWKVTGLYEEWLFMSGGDVGDPLRMLLHPRYHDRPLTVAPYVLGYILTPGSFLGFNVIFAVWALGKGVAMYALIRRLVPTSPALAFVSGALLVVYPSDSALLTLRTTNVHAGVFLFLIALNLLIVAWQRFRWSTLLAMLVAEGIALATYDGGILLSFCGPALLLWLRREIDRRLVAVAVLWWSVPIYFLFTLILTLRDPASYAAEVFAGSGLGDTYSLEMILRSWGYSVARAYVRNFGTGWYEALRGLNWHDPDLQLSAGLTVFVIVPAIWLHASRDEETRPAMDTKRYLVLASLGVVAVLPAFATYLPTVWRNSNWRVFLYSSIGAALAVGVACFLFARLFGQWQRFVFVGLTSALIGIATVHALAQHRGYFEASQRQQQILSSILGEAPRLKPGTTVLLIDRTPTAAFKAFSMCTVVSNCLEWALRYVYGDSTLRAMYCAPGYRPRNEFSEECHFETHRVSVPYVHSGSKKEMRPSSPYASLVVFENSARGLSVLEDISGYQAQAGANGYEPGRRIDAGGPNPPRAHTLFTRWPFKWTEPQTDHDSGPITCSPLC
jgi:hypothetical protein